MTPIRLAAVLSLAFAVRALGQFGSFAPLAVDPPDPTSSDPVTLIVQQFSSCAPPPTVVRSGFDIDVTIHFGPCGPPVVAAQDIELGMLPAGHYTVTANAPSGPSSITFSFDVLDANSGVRVFQSIGSTVGGTSVIVLVDAAHCIGQPLTSCPPPAITFGGIAATNVTVVGQGYFLATTPPHAVGAVEVVVTVPSFTKSSYAFRYYDPLAPPSAKFFERVLIPVVFNGPGAFASQWVTELSLLNGNEYPVEPWRPIAGNSSIANNPILFGSGNAPSGLFLVVPRQASPNLSFHAAVRDTSRADSEWATQIPVVRESQFSNNPIELLDIPIDPRFRTMLRIYSPVNAAPQVRVSVYSIDGHLLRNFFPTPADPTGCSDPVSCVEHPSFVSIPDLTNGLPSGRAFVQIQSSVPLWAFATVTNNDTQHVTVVSPQ